MPGPFVPLDVNYPSDRAIAAAGEAAELLYVRGIAYAKARQTGGFIPDYDIDEVAKRLKKVPERIEKLVTEGLWLKGEGGWHIRGWDRWNESSEELQAKRERDAERQRRRRNKEVTPDVQRDTDVTPAVVTPLKENREEESRTEERTALSRVTPDDPTSALLIEHVHGYAEPLPLSAQAKYKTEIMRLVSEGVEPDRIRRGLTKIRERGLAASLLPQLVTESAPRRSTGDERVAAALALAARYDAEEAGA
jgi:hypothetical protein